MTVCNQLAKLDRVSSAESPVGGIAPLIAIVIPDGTFRTRVDRDAFVRESERRHRLQTQESPCQPLNTKQRTTRSTTDS